MADHLSDWLRLWHIPGIGPRSFNFLLEKFDYQPERILASSYIQLVEQNISKRAARAICEDQTDDYLSDLKWMQANKNHHIILITDTQYPSLLKNIPNPPPILYVCGQLNALTLSPRIAVVGGRKSTMHGKTIAYEFSQQLCELGITIVSGLAKGIDAQAHRGALNTKSGKTIAVLANGLDSIYPSDHRTLAQQITEQSILVSEFPTRVKPLPQHFPRRNRIISGMCFGTIVIEAANKSGSLITARYALEQGREVFAVPGPVNNPLNDGCHRLIQDGAKLTSRVSDILIEFEDIANFDVQNRAITPERKANSANNSPPLLEFIEYTPISIDALIEKSGLTPEQVCSMLTELEIGGRVVCDAYGQYSRSSTD
ncbi:MAG: DNA-processing protein DprA [Pseudomonadota bacterium]